MTVKWPINTNPTPPWGNSMYLSIVLNCHLCNQRFQRYKSVKESEEAKWMEEHSPDLGFFNEKFYFVCNDCERQLSDLILRLRNQ